jgi:TPP-dependent 2-oxoacid decarboxylase
LNSTRQSRKFKTAQNVYNISIKELPENTPTFIRRLFRDILKNVKQKMETLPNDYIRLNIRHPSLDSDIWVEFTQSKNLNEDKILQKIEAVQQSKKEFILTDGATELDFFHVKYPEGSGGEKNETSASGQGEIQEEEASHLGDC